MVQEKKSGKWRLVWVLAFLAMWAGFTYVMIDADTDHEFIAVIWLLLAFLGSCLMWLLLLLLRILIFGYKTIDEQKAIEEKNVRRKRELANKEAVEIFKTKHQAGLPLAEGIECNFVYGYNKISIEGGGNIFNLPLERVRDITLTTDLDIQKSYVSSIGGAAGGAYLFGPIGAMIGGRAKEKISKIETHYLIISYEKDGALDYIAFNLGQTNIWGQKIVGIFQQQERQKVHIDL